MPQGITMKDGLYCIILHPTATTTRMLAISAIAKPSIHTNTCSHQNMKISSPALFSVGSRFSQREKVLKFQCYSGHVSWHHELFSCPKTSGSHHDLLPSPRVSGRQGPGNSASTVVPVSTTRRWSGKRITWHLTVQEPRLDPRPLSVREASPLCSLATTHQLTVYTYYDMCQTYHHGDRHVWVFHYASIVSMPTSLH